MVLIDASTDETRISSGRRDRNKQDKLKRITAAARTLFAEKGVNEVTTSEIANKADVAVGTVFLYARNKGELLLLAQNASYQEAHLAGLSASKDKNDTLRALMALLSPIVICNRAHIENGRTYLREVLFGTGADAHLGEALQLMAGTQSAAANLIAKTSTRKKLDSEKCSKNVMATLFLTLISPANISMTLEEILAELESQIETLV